jgi:hypothetical protein
MEWLKKTKNAFSKCVLEFNFAPISGPYFFIKKKKSKSMYPNTELLYTNICSVADPDHFDTDPDPTFHLDTDLDPTFHFDTDPDPTI